MGGGEICGEREDEMRRWIFVIKIKENKRRKKERGRKREREIDRLRKNVRG